MRVAPGPTGGGRSNRTAWRFVPSPLFACALAGVAAAPLAGQSFTGLVVDENTGRGVPAVAVHLLDTRDDRVGSTLADESGRYRLEIPVAGEYKVMVDRFGYFETVSPLFAVTADRDYPLELSVRPEPIRVEGVDVRVRNERVEQWLTLASAGSPWANPGFRMIQGERIEAAIAKSEDGIAVMRWLHLPAFNSVRRFCVRGYRVEDGCLHIYLDGRYLPSEHLELIDFEELVNVIVLPPYLHLLTRRHTFDPFTPFRYQGWEYGDSIR